MKCLLLAICVACCVVRAADASVGSCPIFNTADEFVALAHLDLTDTAIAVLLAVGATVLAGIYPTWRAAHVQPAWQLKAQ